MEDGTEVVFAEIVARQLMTRYSVLDLSLEGSEVPGWPEMLGHSSGEASEASKRRLRNCARRWIWWTRRSKACGEAQIGT